MSVSNVLKRGGLLIKNRRNVMLPFNRYFSTEKNLPGLTEEQVTNM
jgi:hypothetical protein